MRFGVIGLGSIGLRHIKNIKSLKLDVVGYDSDKSKTSILKKLGITFINDKKKLLESIDACVIATPTENHLKDMILSISKGKHCFVEKPISHEFIQTKKVINLARRKKLIIHVGHNLRFNPAVKFAKKLLNNNSLGEILWSRMICSSYLPSWRQNYDYKNSYTNKKKTGGVVFDSIHEIDLAYYLFGGGKVLSACARNSKTLGLRVEDISNIIIKHPKGFFSNIHLDYVTQPKTRITQIAGTKGILKIDISNRFVQFKNLKGKIVKEEFFKTPINFDYTEEIHNFYRYILQKKSNKINEQESLDVLKLALEARKLAKI